MRAGAEGGALRSKSGGEAPGSELKFFATLVLAFSSIFIYMAVKYHIAPVDRDETPHAMAFILLMFGPPMLVLSLFAAPRYRLAWRLFIASPFCLLLVAVFVSML
jgi:hypothetical protein